MAVLMADPLPWQTPDPYPRTVTGNVISGAGATVKGSVEYAVAELGVRLVVLLGHGRCGAVKAAVKHINANDPIVAAYFCRKNATA